MPNLGRCRCVDGKLCCWDKEGKKFVEIQVAPIYSKQFYEQVVAAFMDDLESGEGK